MPDAVIVSTARTPLCKSWRGAFNMTHGATMGGHALQQAIARARLEPGDVEDVIMGCANPEGATGRNIARQIATIPPSHRTMIVFHNAWQYYNDRFGIRTVGIIELSPGQDPNPQYIGHLTDLARSNHVRAVFAEPEYSPKLVQTLAKSAGIKTIQNLYDDSIANNAQVHDYLSMLRHDTATIVAALK